MGGRAGVDPARPDPTSYGLLQQELIRTRARLDRQVAQLTRLNSVSDELLNRRDDRPLAEAFAEAVVDVLDVAVGAVWVLPPHTADGTDVAVCGVRRPDPAWAANGPALSAALEALDDPVAVDLAALGVDALPGLDLVDARAVRCIGRDGSCSAVLLAANTRTVAGMVDPVRGDTEQVLRMLADKFAVHLDEAADDRLIARQVQQLRDSEQRLALVLQGTNDGWWDWELDAGSCFVSARWLQMMGDPHAEVGAWVPFWADRVHPDERHAFDDALRTAFSGENDTVELEVRLRRDDDGFLPTLVRGTVSRDESGRPHRFAGSLLDLSERKRHEERVRRLAFFDPLTELPNRRMLMDRIQRGLVQAERSGHATAVLMVDLDRFKTLNDTHGHAVGDELLRQVATRLRAAVRGNDTVARLGGDEFVVLLEDLDPDPVRATADAERVGGKLLRTLDAPYPVEVGVAHHTASIGLAVTTCGTETADSMLRRADVALYEAKAAGRNAVRVFHPEMQTRIDRRSDLDQRLREALAEDRLEVHYQAQVDDHGALVGAEALLRWSPDGGERVGPAEFVAVAEDSGFIHVLGDWVLRSVCHQLAAWDGSLPDGFRVAVNVSAAEFLDADFPDRVVQTLARCGVSGTRIRLEITEALVLTELEFAADRMQALVAHGVEFSLDDFGTGYSSLTYLRRLPVAEVKIDRSYVRRLLHDRHDAAIVRAVVALCSSLGLRALAEGVETPDEWARLRADGCHYVQGFLVGEPRPAPADPRDLVHPDARHPLPA